LTSIDLNSDLGEGFGPWRMGDDDAMLAIVTSANVACGFHAGDQDIMARTFAHAKEKGVAIGAHVGFPDLWGFGRRAIPFSPAEIERIVAYQLGAAMALAAYCGHKITYAKAHGALANIAESDGAVARAIVRAVRAVDSSLVLLAIALSEQTKAAQEAGLRFANEIYADRAYTKDGRLKPRREKGAVIDDAEAAIQHTLGMLSEGAIICDDGARLKTPIDSICVHGDTPHAVDMARRLREALADANVGLRAFALP